MLLALLNENALHVSSATAEQLSTNIGIAKETLGQITFSIQDLANGASEQVGSAQNAAWLHHRLVAAIIPVPNA